MASDGAPGPPPVEPIGEGAAEPITLTDADGSVTRVAPWSSWSRSQVRSPGGETALITRLDQGQLWFAAGRSRSPWRHEVHVGPAVVSTPRGRFQVTSEPDGGATIVCLSGRTRVVSGLCEPVVLGPDQTAAVASDGATLVVVDRTRASRSDVRGDRSAPEPDAPVGDPVSDPLRPAAAGAIPLPVSGKGDGSADHEAKSDSSATPSSGAGAGGSALVPAPDPGGGERRLPWLAEVMAMVALLAVVVAAVLVFGRGSSDDTDVAEAPVVTTVEATPTTGSSTTSVTSTSVTSSVPTTAAPTTAAPTTLAPPVTAAPTTSAPPAAAAPGTAEGELVSCRRGEGGVVATVAVSHRSGGPGRFAVMVGLVDASGAMFAQGSADSGVIDRGSTAPVDVVVPVAPSLSGACELLGVAPA